MNHYKQMKYQLFSVANTLNIISQTFSLSVLLATVSIQTLYTNETGFHFFSYGSPSDERLLITMDTSTAQDVNELCIRTLYNLLLLHSCWLKLAIVCHSFPRFLSTLKCYPFNAQWHLSNPGNYNMSPLYLRQLTMTYSKNINPGFDI